MFKASLKNNNIPELGTVTVEFPIPEAQYEETIRALNGIQSGAVVEQDCFVADIGTADCPALERLIGTMANVDELDWLGSLPVPSPSVAGTSPTTPPGPGAKPA